MKICLIHIFEVFTGMLEFFCNKYYGTSISLREETYLTCRRIHFNSSGRYSFPASRVMLTIQIAKEVEDAACYLRIVETSLGQPAQAYSANPCLTLS